ncbi:MAG: glycoside hydrolase family 5 protein [Opitutales bacterium]
MNTLIGRGINVGNALEAPTEGEWGVTIEDKFFTIIDDARFDSVRIAVCWSAHAGSHYPYSIDPAFFERIDTVLDQALSRGGAVILTMHHYNELYDDPSAHIDRFLAIWKQISERYKERPLKLVFEPLNEPHNNLGAPTWNKLIKSVLDVIRVTNPDRFLVFGPVNYNGVRQLESLELPEDDRHIIAMFHYYLPYTFTHQGAHWAAGSNEWLGTKWTGSDAEKQAVNDDFDYAKNWGEAHDRPMMIGEFGAHSKADMESRARWTKYVADSAIAHGFGFTYWDFCAEYFGAYDPGKEAWHKGLLGALKARHEIA